MKQHLIDALSKMTVENGCAPNEESIAKEKIAKYASFMKKERAPQIHHIEENTLNTWEQLADRRYKESFYKLAQENRKKWKI